MKRPMRSVILSFVVLTGTNLLRGTQTSRAPGKLWMAAPMALSSWITGVELGSRGSTVLRFTISGSSMTPPLRSSSSYAAETVVLATANAAPGVREGLPDGHPDRRASQAW